MSYPSVNFHDVVSIKATEITDIMPNGYSRHIVARDKYGSEIELTLFSPNIDDLAIQEEKDGE